jgi:hypothetical protein
MNYEYPNLEKIKTWNISLNTTMPLAKYPEIMKNLALKITAKNKKRIMIYIHSIHNL